MPPVSFLLFFRVTLVHVNLCLHTFTHMTVNLRGVGGRGLFKNFIAAEKQFYPWFKFSFPLFQTHYDLLYITMPTKQRKIKFKPRLKLNYSICTYLLNSMSKGRVSTKSESE